MKRAEEMNQYYLINKIEDMHSEIVIFNNRYRTSVNVQLALFHGM